MCFRTILAVMLAGAPLPAASYYTVRLEDAKAIYLTHDAFPVRADAPPTIPTPSKRLSTRFPPRAG